MFRPKKQSVVGLDLGSYALKCVEVETVRHQTQLRRMLYQPLGGPASDTLLAALTALLKAFPETPRHIRVSVSGPSLVIRRIQLPIMTHAELKGAIRYEAESHLPFAIEECVLDFQILDQVPNQSMMNVLLVAARRDFIQERLDLLASLEIHPEIIDIDAFGLTNAFEHLGDPAGAKIYGLLNVGHEQSSLVIVRDKFPFFIREIPYGGLGVAQALAEIRGISEADAETLKKDLSEANAADLKAATQKGFESLIDEVKNSVDFFENESGEELKTLWMSGGGARALGAADILSEGLSKKVAPWENLKQIALAKDLDTALAQERAGDFNVALGMALRGTQGTR